MVWEYGLSVAEVNLEMASLRRNERNAMCSQPSSKLAVLHVQSHHLDTATLQQLCCVSNKNVASPNGRNGDGSLGVGLPTLLKGDQIWRRERRQRAPPS